MKTSVNRYFNKIIQLKCEILDLVHMVVVDGENFYFYCKPLVT